MWGALMTSVMSLRYQPAPPPNHPISYWYRIGWLGGGAGWYRKAVTDVTGAPDKDSTGVISDQTLKPARERGG